MHTGSHAGCFQTACSARTASGFSFGTTSRKPQASYCKSLQVTASYCKLLQVTDRVLGEGGTPVPSSALSGIDPSEMVTLLSLSTNTHSENATRPSSSRGSGGLTRMHTLKFSPSEGPPGDSTEAVAPEEVPSCTC